MKKFSILTVLTCLTIAATAQTEVNSQIEKVTIYPSNALVEKCVTVNLKKGDNTFIIHGNAADLNSTDIHFASSPDWFIGSMNCHRIVLPTMEVLAREMPGAAFTQYQALRAQADEVVLKISNADIMISTLNMQAQAINNMKAIRNTAAFDTIVNLKAQLEYQRKESQAINSQIAKTKKEKEELNIKQRQLEKQIDDLVIKYTGGKQVLNTQYDIYVSIYSNKAIPNAKIDYSYRTNRVRCNYAYDVMFYEDTKQAVFSLKAAVAQTSGEHWRNCRLVFSTTDAGYAGFDSELPIFYLRAMPQPVPAMAKAARTRNMVMASVMKESAEESDANVLNDLAIYDPGTVSTQTLSREYSLNTNQAILSYENAQTMMLHRDTTKVLFARFATPKNEEKVHFTALLPDWENMGLLNAECNVYMNNRFISTSSVSTEGSGDTLRFSVGQDPNVQVKRKHVISTPDKGLLSKEVTQTINITLTVKNTKNEPIELRMKDQVPISADTEIKVVDINTNGGILDEKTGIVRWILSLKALEQRTITLSYTVKYPKEKSGAIYLR